MVEYILNIGNMILDSINILFGINMAGWVLLSFILGVVFVFVLFFVLSKLSTNKLNNKQKLVYEYDNIFYHIAASQYKLGLKSKDVKVQDEHLDIIKKIIVLKNPSYIGNVDLIRSSVDKIEKSLGKQVTQKSVWDKINYYNQKLKKLSLFYKIFQILLFVLIVGLIGLIIYI